MSLEQAHPVLGRHPIGVICDVTSGEQLMSQGLRKVPGKPGIQGAKFPSLSLFVEKSSVVHSLALRNVHNHRVAKQLKAPSFESPNRSDYFHLLLSTELRLLHPHQPPAHSPPNYHNTTKNPPHHTQLSLAQPCSFLQRSHAKRVTHKPQHPTSRPSAYSPHRHRTPHPP